MKISPGIIARLHHIEQRQKGLRKEQCAAWKKAPLLYCCNQVWMKVGGRILWNVTPICETSQIYYLMGRRPMKDVLGNQRKDQLLHLVHRLSIIPWLSTPLQKKWLEPLQENWWNLNGWCCTNTKDDFASWFLVPIHLISILGSKLIRSSNQSRAMLFFGSMSHCKTSSFCGHLDHCNNASWHARLGE